MPRSLLPLIAFVFATTLIVDASFARPSEAFFVKVDSETTTGAAVLESVDGPNNLLDIDPDAGVVSVFYDGLVVQSSISLLPVGTPFTVDGAGTIQPNPLGDPPFIANVDLTASIVGDFSLTFGGTIEPLDFSLIGGPQPVGQTGITITSHRITPEPGSLLLLGLGVIALGARRRRSA